MSPKKLLPFIAVLIVLVIIAFLTRPPGKKELSEEVELTALVPLDFRVSDIKKITMYIVKQEENATKVVLIKKDGAWVAGSKWNAPCDGEKIGTFLEKINSLEGEFRSSSEEVLVDYGLTDDTALDLRFFTSTADDAAPLVHLKVGKKERWTNSFVRLTGDNNVYTVDVNLRSEVGLYGDESGKGLDEGHWLNKSIVDLDKEKLTKIVLEWPDKEIAFEKQEKQEDRAAPEKEEAGEVEEKKEYEWIVTDGGFDDAPLKESGINQILSSLDSWSASDLVDPGKKEEWGLDKPNFKCSVELEDGKTIVLIAVRKHPTESGYVMMEEKPDVVYKVSQWTLNRLFPLGNTLFDLPQLDENQEDIRSITLSYPDMNVSFSREDKDQPWQLIAPQADLELKATGIDAIASTLSGLKAVDYVDTKREDVAGLTRASKKGTFTLKGDKSHTVTIGNDSLVDRGAYVRFDEHPETLAIGGTDLDSVFPGVNQIFDLDLVAMTQDELATLEIKHGKNLIIISQEQQGEFALTWNGDTIDFKKDTIEELIRYASWLKAESFITGTTDLAPGEQADYVKLTSHKGDSVLLTLGKEKDGRIATRRKGTVLTFLVDKRDIGRLQPARSDIEKPAPPPQPGAHEDEASSLTLLRSPPKTDEPGEKDGP